MDRRILLLAAGLLTASGTAQAQDTVPPAAAPAAEQSAALDPSLRDMRLDDFEDMTVYGSEGETVGDVAEVIRGNDGRLLAVVETQSWLGFETGAIAIPMEFVRRDGDALRLPSLTKDQVREIQEEDATDYGEVSGYETLGEAWDSRIAD